MKRRTFIRNIGALSATLGVAPGAGFARQDETSVGFKHIQQLTLKEFEDEHEEYPSLVTDNNGQSWLFSLRRLPYPENNEIISAFRLTANNWEELDPVSVEEGQYEYPTAECASGGYPIVAWTRKMESSWVIEVSVGSEEGFRKPFVFKPTTGKYINPVLLATSPGSGWLAWEKYDKGRFSLCISQLEDGSWSKPLEVKHEQESLFNPALVEDRNGNLYLAYGITSGVHQNIEMKKVDGKSLEILDDIPVAIGGGLKDRVNMNTNPALCFDATDRLWISWENNRKTHRLEDGDNFTGDRICAMVCYEDGVLKEQKESGKWLFDGKNDHLPTFVKDNNDNLFAVTHCGGDFTGNPFWKYRISRLDIGKGWSTPETFLETSQKGQTNRPAVIFEQSSMWLATRPESWFSNGEETAQRKSGQSRQRLSKLELHKFEYKSVAKSGSELQLMSTTVREYLPDPKQMPVVSGRSRIKRKTIEYKGETYTLLLGNLHEHTEISSCWPAGCDGTIHDDYRFGIYSEGYDFMGITDHGYSLNEVYWRKNLRMVDFYSDNVNFVAIPSLEWTLSNGRGNVDIKPGVGHKNIFFPSEAEALKFIRNKDEVYSVSNEETIDAVALWKFLHHQQIDCVTIPHHPADEVHATDWEVHDEHYQPVVEIFQCRGNAEYPNCPREINVTRHKPTPNKKAYIDYALNEKGHKMGFVASGDHNSIGVGVAALWVREVSQKGIVDALKHRHCFATTGDKIFVHMTVNGAWGEEEAILNGKSPEIAFEIETVDKIRSIEILRNSKVIKRIKPSFDFKHMGTYVDNELVGLQGQTHYYMRVIQENNHIAWSSPVWVG